MKKLIITITLVITIFSAYAQQVGVGQWRDHLPYNKGVSVAPAVNRIYVASSIGLFYYDLFDNSITRLSKVTGLSDIGVKVVRYNKQYNTLVVGYENGNLDLIINGNTIENYPDIKLTNSILGLKTINNIMFIDSRAYLATNFGITVFDLADKEFKETYIIGPGGSNINVSQTATDGTYLYAATDIGLYKAPLNSSFLNDFNVWTVDTNLPNGTGKKLNTVCFVNNRLYVNLSTEAYDADTSYVNSGSGWTERDPNAHFDIRTMTSYDNKLIITSRYGAQVYTDNTTISLSFDQSGYPDLNPAEATYDEVGNFWVADMNAGAYATAGPLGTQKVTPQGPGNKSSINMVHTGSKLYVVPGGTIYYQNQFTPATISIYDGTQWDILNGKTDTAIGGAYDLMSIAIDPTDANHAYFTSWGRGLIEKKGNIYNRFRPDNSPILYQPSGDRYYSAGAAFETNGKLWFSNAFVPTGIITRKTDGAFQAYDFGSLLNGKFTSQITIDSYGQKWVVIGRGGGLLVFKENTNGTIPNSQRRLLGTSAGTGALPDADVRCVVEDLENQMWVGTAKGVCIFYSPESVLSGSNFDAQKPGIVEGGFFYPLLENEIVTCIAVDGANRKWIGTEKGGLFLVSADGSQQLLNFNIDNSPLLSNSIYSLAIDPKTGEVFIGTEQGIVSYRGDATQGGDKYENVYAFPNPVRPNYTGPISIKGLVKDVDVKITDIAGRVIYQTKANGGQATWNGNGFDGNRAKSGVYLVFTSNTDGSETNVTKIMIIN